MAVQPTKWPIQIGVNSNQIVIPTTAGADDIDLSKLWPSSYELPLDAGGNAVGRTEMNTLFAMSFENLYFMQQGGVYIYDASINYTVGTRVLYNGDLYKCIQNNGSLNPKAPTDPAYWDRFITERDLSSFSDPVGVIKDYGGVSAPPNYLICDGSAISRTTYSKLFAVIGTKFGAGNGTTTFNLPNLINKFSKGVGSGSVGTTYPATLPTLVANSNGAHTHTTNSAGAHTHTRGTMEIVGRAQFGGSANGGYSASGALSGSGFNGISGTGGGEGADNNIVVDFRASRNWTGSTSSDGAHTHTAQSAGAHTHTVSNSNGVATGTTVQPDSVGVLKIIKYQ